MSWHSSGQAFVRALKAPSDPPQPDQPSKLEISRSGWDDVSFHVPSKGLLILEWLLTKFLKERSNDAASNPLVDARYWSLLADVLSGSPNIKTQLVPLLNRTPLAPIATSFLSLLSSVDLKHRESLLPLARKSLAILWPIAVQKFSADALLECWGALIQALGVEAENEDLTKIGMMINDAYASSLSNASNKRKLNQTFISTHLTPWIRYTDQDSYSTLSRTVYALGIDILFPLDVLRSTLYPSHVFSALQSCAQPYKASTLSILPGLFESYAAVLKRFRGTLFSTGSKSKSAGNRDVEGAAMTFFISSQDLLKSHSDTGDKLVWETRARLVEVVRKLSLYVDQQQEEGKDALEMNIKLALETLGSSNHDRAISVLHNIQQTSQTLLAPSVPQIMSKLLVLHTSESTTDFLSLLLDHYAKTRTIPVYLELLLSTISAFDISSTTPSVKPYRLAHKSALLGRTHSDALAAAVRGFVTPSQVNEITEVIGECVHAAWAEYQNRSVGKGDGEGKTKKKRRLDGTSADAGADAAAIRLSLLSRFSPLILGSLPLHVLRSTEQEGLLQSIEEKLGRSFITSVFVDFLPTKSDEDDGKKKKKRKAEESRSDEGRLNSWADQVVFIAALMMDHGLNNMIHEPTQGVSVISGLTPDLLSQDDCIGELLLEIIRTSLAQRDTNPQVIHAIMDYIRRYSQPHIAWSGYTCDLDATEDGKRATVLAIVYLIAERFLIVMEASADMNDLEAFIEVLLSYDNSEQPRNGTESLETETVSRRLLRNAEFWELGRLRGALISYATSLLLPFATVTPSQALSDQKLPQSFDLRQLQNASQAFEAILYAPAEYLSKGARTEFMSRAMVIDAISAWSEVDDAGFRNLTATRLFLKRALAFTGAVEHDALWEYLEFLIVSSPSIRAESRDTWLTVTLELVELHLQTIARLAEKQVDEGNKALAKVSWLFLRLRPFTQSVSPQSLLWRRSLTKFLEILVNGFSFRKFTGSIRESLEKLHQDLIECLLPVIETLSSTGYTIKNADDACQALEAWDKVLSVDKWLNSGRASLLYGKKLVTNVLPLLQSGSYHGTAEAMSFSILRILLGELKLEIADHHSHLDVILAAYVTLRRLSTADGQAMLDGTMEQMTRSLSPADFAHVLELVSEALSTSDTSENDTVQLINLSNLLLHDAPEGTLRMSQAHLTHFLNTFANRSIFVQGPLPLRLTVLHFLSRQCADKPALLRSWDLCSLWIVLSNFLTGCESHDETTCVTIFQQIVSVVSALVRLRRDLVLSTLPQLGMVLRQLILCTRNLRPHLGGKQRRMVEVTLPRWIDGDHPLGMEESKALARLLTALTTKSVIRMHGTSAEAQKAESLARPFSKHAAYVLKAYIDAMNDPLCVMPSEIRKELQPGLFSLCDMLNEHSRDAMMVSALDAGGKATIKALWREYEKQRYVGRG